MSSERHQLNAVPPFEHDQNIGDPNGLRMGKLVKPAMRRPQFFRQKSRLGAPIRP
jgi:hypothetical protein